MRTITRPLRDSKSTGRTHNGPARFCGQRGAPFSSLSSRFSYPPFHLAFSFLFHLALFAVYASSSTCGGGGAMAAAAGAGAGAELRLRRHFYDLLWSHRELHVAHSSGRLGLTANDLNGAIKRFHSLHHNRFSSFPRCRVSSAKNTALLVDSMDSLIYDRRTIIDEMLAPLSRFW